MNGMANPCWLTPACLLNGNATTLEGGSGKLGEPGL